MKLVQTKDGSFTAYNEKAKEHYHSVSGAMEEAFEKHVNALGIADGMHILDFCFGLGYNSIAATKYHQDLRIIGLENDPKIIKLMQNVKLPELLAHEYDYFRNLSDNNEINDPHNNQISLRIGDALYEIDKLPNQYFDRVFFDPFSPKKQPEMWTEELFRKIYDKMKIGGKLSTYSCAVKIRKNLANANFAVIDGPIIGRRSPATIAIKKADH
jgi:tRNA U34 5-methylaminomethyl-2-thiouridine-forming methyltransferase MnmC